MTAVPAPTAATAAAPNERVLRGVLLSLVSLPVGIVLFSVVYGLGYFAAIVFVAVSALTVWLYRLGAGRVGVAGIIAISLVVLVTFFVSFGAGIAWSLALEVQDFFGGSAFAALTAPEFGQLFAAVFQDPEVSGAVMQDMLLGLLFAVLGAGIVLRGVIQSYRSERAVAAANAAGPSAPSASPSQPQASAPQSSTQQPSAPQPPAAEAPTAG